ncbi:uncharacterized protein SEPMUDRAFT_148979 [Sphaerulina musiva SO2202]|uniref:Uncharacterized protein n=1 Tax=Sphaerulina musiva (strain SO2202) TaxID=692275 RepID=M3D7F2_SPHMS|nr:uncharacterized protein SEPMUDRAFT_148979 [Sphaerulina musiva SO2202]EMF13804.1 hypothetical protein SEPMUDRAFT_148979 [Sphaerulina musiva SO2202]
MANKLTCLTRRTHRYPASMNWDKDFLAKPSSRTPHHPPPHTPVSATKEGKIRRRRSRPISHSDDVWLEDLMDTVEDIQSPLLFLPSHNGVDDDDGNEKKDMLANPTTTTTTTTAAVNPYANMSDKDRIRIKRRKVGKFIGLVGMETPVEEIAARIQSSLDRAMERSREELRRNEQIMTGRKKMA